MLKSKEVKSILNVTQQTLCRYVKDGKLNPVKLSKTRYLYEEDEVFGLLGTNQKGNKERMTITYARVSTPKQKGDLVRQNERLYQYTVNNGFELSMQLSDIKSGMEFEKRKAFKKLISLIAEGKVKRVIVENKDRLVRFGFDLVKELFRLHGTEVIVVSDVENKSYEQELTDDLISIIQFYSMKSYSNRRKLNKAAMALKEEDKA